MADPVAIRVSHVIETKEYIFLYLYHLKSCMIICPDIFPYFSFPYSGRDYILSKVCNIHPSFIHFIRADQKTGGAL